MFDTILIANRGEIAVRLVRACRDLGVRSVVAHSTADRDSLAVHLADDAVCIGPPPASRSYRNIPALLYACARAGADAIHPGYGFLSEDATFAAACRDAGITFVGPAPEHIAAMGDKIAARAAMAAAGVPILPGSPAPVRTAAEALDAAAGIGYPVLIKAAAGGGGRGIALVRCAGELPELLARTQDTARTLYADDRVYLEKYVERARHIEVQILADRHGTVVHLGERDCSVQDRRQKLIEETPAPNLDPRLRDLLLAASVAGAKSLGYESAGTFEFVVGDGQDAAHFIEMNTRLQVEHPVTEIRYGVDLVAWMIRVAAGERLAFTQPDLSPAGHAIEARLVATSPAGPGPAAGRVTGLSLPQGPGLRVDTHVYEGYAMPPFYDPLLAKIIASGPDRAATLAVLRRALHEARCQGVTTNLGLLEKLTRQPAFEAGTHRSDIITGLQQATHRNDRTEHQ